jgi:hypothetical protein
MRRQFPKDDDSRFSGGVRHYHRSPSTSRGSWDFWVDGSVKKRGRFTQVLKIAGVILAMVALVAIAVGLFIELR